MIDEHFTACILVIGKGAGPGANVGGIESFGDSGVVEVEVIGIVGRVIDNVSKPALEKKRAISVRGISCIRKNHHLGVAERRASI